MLNPTEPLLVITASEIRAAASAVVAFLARIDPTALYRAILEGRLGADVRDRVCVLTPTTFEAILRDALVPGNVEATAEGFAARLQSTGLIEVVADAQRAA